MKSFRSGDFYLELFDLDRFRTSLKSELTIMFFFLQATKERFVRH